MYGYSDGAAYAQTINMDELASTPEDLLLALSTSLGSDNTPLTEWTWVTVCRMPLGGYGEYHLDRGWADYWEQITGSLRGYLVIRTKI